jgi:hypothetical protein
MGIYDHVRLEDGVVLPAFPERLDAQGLGWQTKDIRYPGMRTFKITADGRLLRRELDRREKTDEEKQTEAAEHGFDTWESYREAVRSGDLGTNFERGLPVTLSEEVVESEWWADHNQHGSFEFRASSPEGSGYDIVWSYEARSTRGSLDEVVFLGDRHGGGPDDFDI